MIFKLLKKHNQQNKLIKDNSDNIMNMNELKSKAVKFEESVIKDKKRAENNDEFIISKIKNVKLADILHKIAE